jgi:hypothetical protein
MTDDLRKQRSESVEGKGRARRAWDGYATTVSKLRPRWMDDAVKQLAYRWTEDMVGFWVCWHIYGGFEGLQRAGWNERTIFRRLRKFRLVFHTHPDDFELPGVSVDLEAYWNAFLPKRDGE